MRFFQKTRVFNPLYAVLLILGFAISACDDGGNASVDGSANDGDHAIGDPNAPITMIEYASLTCGHCANFHANVFKELKTEYIDTGKVYFIFREFPTPPADRAVAGFMLASCMPEDRYFDVLDVIFQEQRALVTAPDAYPVLKGIAQMGGLNEDQLKACLSDQAELDRIIAVQEYASEDLGVGSTPTFIINGEVYTNRPYDQLKAILDPLLKDTAS